MKAYLRLLLAYIDTYKRVDYTLLKAEFSVNSKQILCWIEELIDKGYVIWKDGEIHLTPLGRVYKSDQWLSFSICNEKETDMEFEWDYLYIPKKLE
jgi:predicted transcriptional regulator